MDDCPKAWERSNEGDRAVGSRVSWEKQKDDEASRLGKEQLSMEWSRGEEERVSVCKGDKRSTETAGRGFEGLTTTGAAGFRPLLAMAQSDGRSILSGWWWACSSCDVAMRCRETVSSS